MILRPDKPIYPLMSIDPGKNALGWAYFGAGGFLTAAGVARTGTNHRPGGEDLGTVTRFLMRQLTEAWHGLMPARIMPSMTPRPKSNSSTLPSIVTTAVAPARSGSGIAEPEPVMTRCMPSANRPSSISALAGSTAVSVAAAQMQAANRCRFACRIAAVLVLFLPQRIAIIAPRLRTSAAPR